MRYMDLDDTLATSQPLPTDIVTAYKPAALTALRGVLRSDNNAFEVLWGWFRGHVPRLVLCHDREVRKTLADVISKQQQLSSSIET